MPLQHHRLLLSLFTCTHTFSKASSLLLLFAFRRVGAFPLATQKCIVSESTALQSPSGTFLPNVFRWKKMRGTYTRQAAYRLHSHSLAWLHLSRRKVCFPALLYAIHWGAFLSFGVCLASQQSLSSQLPFYGIAPISILILSLLATLNALFFFFLLLVANADDCAVRLAALLDF